MSHNYRKDSRRRTRCQLTRLEGLDVGDAIAVAANYPLDYQAELDRTARIGHFIEPNDQPQDDVCGRPDSFPF